MKYFSIKTSLMLLLCLTLSGCGSVISRTVAGQGQGSQYFPGVQWDLRQGYWRFLTILDLPLSLIVDTLLLPVDIKHGPYE